MNTSNATVSKFKNRVVVRGQCANSSDYAELCEFAEAHDVDGKTLIVVGEFSDVMYAKAYEAVKQYYRNDSILKEVAVEPFPALNLNEMMQYAPLNLDLHQEINRTLKGCHAASSILYKAS